MFAFLFVALVHAESYSVSAPACGRPVATELYANENFETFPCDLRHLRGRKKHPKIWVVGETHDWSLLNPDITADQKKTVEGMVEFWNIVREMAVQSQIYLLVEGYQASVDGRPATVESYVERMRDHQAMLPIEDGFAYLMAIFTSIRVSFQASMFRTLGSKREAAEKDFRHYAGWIFQLLWTSPYLSDAWKRVPRPLNNPNAEAAGALLDRLSCDKNGAEVIGKWVSAAPIEQVYDLAELFEAVGEAFAKRLGDLHPRQLDLSLEPFGEMLAGLNKGGNNNRWGEWQETGLRLTSPVREALMAVNTAKIYCAMIKAGTTRPLVLQVGRDHVPGIMRHLKAMAVRTGLSPRHIRTRPPKFDANELKSED